MPLAPTLDLPCGPCRPTFRQNLLQYQHGNAQCFRPTPEPRRRLAHRPQRTKLINWKVSDELRERIEELGQKANLGILTAEEDAEYRAYLDDAELISLMQAKTRRLYGMSK